MLTLARYCEEADLGQTELLPKLHHQLQRTVLSYTDLGVEIRNAILKGRGVIVASVGNVKLREGMRQENGEVG